MDKNKIVKYIY